MKLDILKKGQGLHARRIAYFLGGALVLFGAIRFYATFNVPNQHVFVKDVPLIGSITLYNVLAILVFFVGMLVLHLFLNREKHVDLLIETEQEMKKVSWPSWAEVKSASIVVIVVTLVMALLLFGFDWLLQRVFGLVWGA